MARNLIDILCSIDYKKEDRNVRLAVLHGFASIIVSSPSSSNYNENYTEDNTSDVFRVLDSICKWEHDEDCQKFLKLLIKS